MADTPDPRQNRHVARRRKRPQGEAATPDEPSAAPAEEPAQAKPSPPPRRGRGGRHRQAVEVRAPEPAPVQETREAPTSGRLSELEAIAKMDAFDMDALLGASTVSTELPEIGTRVRGTVSALGEPEVQLDLGLWTDGYIASVEVPGVAVGDPVEGFVVAADDLGVRLSQRLTGPAAAAHLEEAAEAGIPVSGRVDQRTGAGFVVRIGPVRAFLPISQASRIPLADPDGLVGQELDFRVLEAGDKVVVSRRALEEEAVADRVEAFWVDAAVGDVHDAVVTSVQSFGVFVDLDGVDALLPKREASWEDVEDLTTRFERGQRLRVRLLGLDPDTRKVSVSAKDPSLDPWLSAHAKLPVGGVVRGRVANVAAFGVFVALDSGLEGLLHRSHLDGAATPDRGDEIDVRVLSIDVDRRRIELAPAAFDPALQAAQGVGTEVQGEVVEIGDRGVALRLDDGRRAWLPTGEADLAPNQVLSQRFRVGHAVTVRVLKAGDRPLVTEKTADRSASAWREHVGAKGAEGGMGTLGDLLGRLKR